MLFFCDLQISCKFYHYNPDSKEWQERGMGTLRLNQHIDTKDDVRLGLLLDGILMAK
jgi:hypothetical protein